MELPAMTNPGQNQFRQMVGALLGSIELRGTTATDGAGRRSRLLEKANAHGDRFDLVIERQADGDTQTLTVVRGLAAGAYGSPNLGVGMDGHLVVVWEVPTNLSICGQRLDPQGMPVGGVFTVNSSSDRSCRLNPGVRVNASGAFVVMWEHGWTQTRARIFDGEGVANNPEFTVGPSANNANS